MNYLLLIIPGKFVFAMLNDYKCCILASHQMYYGTHQSRRVGRTSWLWLRFKACSQSRDINPLCLRDPA